MIDEPSPPLEAQQTLLTAPQLALLRDAMVQAYPAANREAAREEITDTVVEIGQRNLAAYRHSHPERSASPVLAAMVDAIPVHPDPSAAVRPLASFLPLSMMADDGTDFSSHALMGLIATWLGDLLSDAASTARATPAMLSASPAVSLRLH